MILIRIRHIPFGMNELVTDSMSLIGIVEILQQSEIVAQFCVIYGMAFTTPDRFGLDHSVYTKWANR